MFGHRAIHISNFAGTQQMLTFFRNVPGVRASGEESSNFWPVCTLCCDVQPNANSSVLNTKLATTYAQMYMLTTNGDADVYRNDRTVIDGAECIVETVHRWGGHTEIEVGAREAGANGNVLVNQRAA